MKGVTQLTTDDLRQALAAGSDWRKRLLQPADGRTLEEWRREVWNSPAYAPMIEELREEADRLLAKPIAELPWTLLQQVRKDGSRKPYAKPYFERRRRLAAYALLTMLDSNLQQYRDELCNTIWAICDEYSWCLPAHMKKKDQADTPEFTMTSHTYSTRDDAWLHQQDGLWVDLFAAETAFAFCEIEYVLGERLPEPVRTRMKYEGFRRVLHPYMNGGPFWWEQARNNWSAVCAGSIGSAAIYLVNDEEELAALLNKAIGSIKCFLEGYGADGACREGYLYWTYGFGYFVYFADLLKKRTGGTIDLFGEEKICEIAKFPQRCFMYGNKVVNFSDSSSDGRVFPGLSHYLHGLFPDVELPESSLRSSFTDDSCSRFAHAIRNFLWMSPEKNGNPWGQADYWMPNAEWLLSRVKTMNGESYCFAAKGGHNAESHNHNDIGHFIVSINGKPLLVDMGSGLYTAQYFGEERYTFLSNSSRGHSLPLIDGACQQPGKDHKAHSVQVTVEDSFVTLAMDIARAYSLPHLSSLIRRFHWKKEELPSLVLEDAYTFTSKPDSIVERLICLNMPQFDGEGSILIGNEETLVGKSIFRVQYDASELEPSVEKLPSQNQSEEWIDFYALDFKMKKPDLNSKVRLDFVFGPFEPDFTRK